MLELHIVSITHQSVNSGCFSLVPWFLQDAPDFGSAVRRIDLNPYFDDEKSTFPRGDADLKRYRERLDKLPELKFSRRNKNLTIKYRSKVCMGIDLQRKAMAREPDSPIENRSVYYFREFYGEMLTLFECLRTIMKPSDDFDVDLFLAYLSKKRSSIPKTNDKLFEAWRDQFKNPTQLTTSFAPPRAAMNEQQFWKFISLIRQTALDEEKGKAAVPILVDKLSKLPPDEIESFHRTLVDKLYAIDTYRHFRGAEENSDDAFLYDRCYVVGKGQKYYEQVLANPELMPKDPPWFEELLHVAADAWATATNDDPNNFPWNVSDKSYMTGSNSEGWVEADQ